ncbi:hypothetical protein ACIP01_19235 [Pseudomonas monteilii]|uniref:hypothetical protein n=1 Tax=Pseudomonas monteilii TaxID=76759 RepID=UPI0038110269
MNSWRNAQELHRQWLRQNQGMLGQELEYLNEDLADGSQAGLESVSDSLGIVATYHGIQGEVAICSGDTGGWEGVSRALLYRYWALRIKARSFSTKAFLGGLNRAPNLTNQFSSAGGLLAAFISADRQDLAGTVADILAGMIDVEGAVDAEYLKRRRFEPFMLWLYAMYSVQTTARVGSAFGVYQGVVDRWTDEQRFGGALREVCRYHLTNIEDQGADWDPEFKHPPFDLLPLEVVAILKVRQKLGLFSPDIEHELICAETSAVELLTLEPDGVVLRVEAAYESLWG